MALPPGGARPAFVSGGRCRGILGYHQSRRLVDRGAVAGGNQLARVSAGTVLGARSAVVGLRRDRAPRVARLKAPRSKDTKVYKGHKGHTGPLRHRPREPMAVMTAPSTIDATTAEKCSSTMCASVVNSQYRRKPASAISPQPRPQRMPVTTRRVGNARFVRKAAATRIGTAQISDVRKHAIPKRHWVHVLGPILKSCVLSR